MTPDTERPTIDLPLEGGCACGALRYRLGSAPILLFACHCHQCQRQSGSAFGQSLRVRRADLTLSGEVQTRMRQTERGTTSETVFCPGCGARIFNARPGTEFCHLRGGTLDDTSWLRPAAHIWTDSAQPWMRFDPEVLISPGQPDDLGAIEQLWQSKMSPRFR
ncbi:GFA family protein [Pararhodobacter sp. CCB-MM2]|uniref:GFA family protein n=1 Tax=Pararhodobacter sp. CCB-MM2 TaxID=1786003 RepID=UPI000834ABBD|nr:GFA family protein [Pararhodobacter sp. CCB-MM2]